MKTNIVVVKLPAEGKVPVVGVPTVADPATAFGEGEGAGEAFGEGLVGPPTALGDGLGEGLGLPLGEGEGELFAWAKG